MAITAVQFEVFGIQALAAQDLPVRIGIYDVAGRVVRDLLDARIGTIREVTWDGRDDEGTHVPAGIYYYRLQVDREVVSRSIVRLY